MCGLAIAFLFITFCVFGFGCAVDGWVGLLDSLSDKSRADSLLIWEEEMVLDKDGLNEYIFCRYEGVLILLVWF